MLDVTRTTLGGVHDLDRGRSRGRLDRPHVDHQRRLRARLVHKSDDPPTQTRRSQLRGPRRAANRGPSQDQLTPNSTPKIIASSASGRRAAERAANREEQKVLAGSWRNASLGRRSGGARHASPVWHCVECVLFVRSRQRG